MLNFAKVLTYSNVLLYTLVMENEHRARFFIQKWRRQTYAVSGASLSRFSSKYLTSEINKHPALLNSFDEILSVQYDHVKRKCLAPHLDPISGRQRPLPPSVVSGEVGMTFCRGRGLHCQVSLNIYKYTSLKTDE